MLTQIVDNGPDPSKGVNEPSTLPNRHHRVLIVADQPTACKPCGQPADAADTAGAPRKRMTYFAEFAR
jgi:hypothetical protein